MERVKRIANRARRLVIETVHRAGTGHIGGPLSAMDILATLYFCVANVRPEEPRWPERDRIILSKGHAGIGLYAMLAQKGYLAEEELFSTFDAADSRMQAHPDMTVLPGLDMSTGSLGQGLSAGVGMALAARHLRQRFRTFVIIGDGETQEGQIWEAADVASKYGLGNLTCVLDHNGLQQFGFVDGDRRRAPNPNAAERFRAFGWNVIECDGHDIAALIDAFAKAKEVVDQPTIVVALTIKGKGVSFMEGMYEWHSKLPTDAELEQSIRELEGDVANGH